MCIKRLIARVFDIRNAFRVLDIMDKCGCDIDRATNVSEDYPESWIIKPKWYVTEQDAKDLQKYNSKTDDGEEYEKWLESNA